MLYCEICFYRRVHYGALFIFRCHRMSVHTHTPSACVHVSGCVTAAHLLDIDSRNAHCSRHGLTPATDSVNIDGVCVFAWPCCCYASYTVVCCSEVRRYFHVVLFTQTVFCSVTCGGCMFDRHKQCIPSIFCCLILTLKLH